MPNHWILQSSADRIDHETYLEVGGTTLHGVRRYPDRIAPGDRVWLWRAKGKARVIPGVVALGTITETASFLPFDRPDSARGETVLRPKLRVRVQVDETRFSPTAGMITREDVRRLPEMATHPIVTSNTGSDFTLSAEQVAALQDLWDGGRLGPVI